MTKKELIFYLEKLIDNVEKQAQAEHYDPNGANYYAGYLQGLKHSLDEIKLLEFEELVYE